MKDKEKLKTRIKKAFIEKWVEAMKIACDSDLKECIEYLENAVKLRRKSNEAARKTSRKLKGIDLEDITQISQLICEVRNITEMEMAGDAYFVASSLRAKNLQ